MAGFTGCQGFDTLAWKVAGRDDVDAPWVTGIRAEYRRYPALQRELDSHLGRV